MQKTIHIQLLHGYIIEEKETAKYLGITLHNKLSWNDSSVPKSSTLQQCGIHTPRKTKTSLRWSKEGEPAMSARTTAVKCDGHVQPAWLAQPPVMQFSLLQDCPWLGSTRFSPGIGLCHKDIQAPPPQPTTFNQTVHTTEVPIPDNHPVDDLTTIDHLTYQF